MKKLLLVDSSSVAVTLFYAKGGQEFLDKEEVIQQELEYFLEEVAREAIDNIERRVTLDRFSTVRLALETPPEHLCWRYEVYPSYKHSYSASTLHVARTLQPYVVREAYKRGIQTLYAKGMEADDVIATMVEKALPWVEQGNEIYIWSLDKDLHQLVDRPGIFIIGKAGETTDYKTVVEYWGVSPIGVPLMKALMGDPSDNIPGITGIGKKTASKFLRDAPYRKPTPYWIDYSKVPERFQKTIRSLERRIVRDEILCTLKRDIKELIPGETYITGIQHGEKETAGSEGYIGVPQTTRQCINHTR